MKRILLLVVVTFLAGCGGEEATVNSNITNSCGITSVEDDQSKFRFHCGLEGDDTYAIKDLSNVSLKKDQVCEVFYSENGQPKAFFCEDKPESIDGFIARGASLEGDWICTGLDGYGGTNEIESELNLKAEGAFELKITAKEKTDSVWFISDSVISGEFAYDKGAKVILSPQNWNSDVIKKSGLKLADAPAFMLTAPLSITIKNLTKQELSGEARRLSNPTRVESNVRCSAKSNS